MNRLNVFQGDRRVGSIPAPDSFRMPMSTSEMEAIPALLIARSSSWLFKVRDGDFWLAVRDDALVVEAALNICPGDFGLVVGFQPAEGCEHFQAEPEMLEVADKVWREHVGAAAAR